MAPKQAGVMRATMLLPIQLLIPSAFALSQSGQEELQINAAGVPELVPHAGRDSLLETGRVASSGRERRLFRQDHNGAAQAPPLPPPPPKTIPVKGHAVLESGTQGQSAKERAFAKREEEIRASLAGALKSSPPSAANHMKAYGAGRHRGGHSLEEAQDGASSRNLESTLLGDGAEVLTNWEPTAEEPFDCQAGLKAWKRGWSDEKKKWCCDNREVGCEESATADDESGETAGEEGETAGEERLQRARKKKRKKASAEGDEDRLRNVEHFESGPSAKGSQVFVTPWWINIGLYTPNGAEYEGAVRVKSPIKDETTLSIVTEENRACMQELSVFECMDRLGSYGLRKLYSYSYNAIQANGWERPDWMSHEAVQNRTLLDLTLPMSHASASFDMEGKHAEEMGMGSAVRVVRQNLDIYQQLRLGIRALDIDVAYNLRNKMLYAANGLLTVSLARVFMDIKKFLEEFPKEVIVLDMRKAKLLPSNKWGTVEPLEKSAWKALPAQIVQTFVQALLGDYLADHDKLAAIGGAVLENPTVADLVSVDARIVYFWEGQQVLCTSWSDCLKTPGWKILDTKEKFTFGQPMEIGTRPAKTEAATTSKYADKVVEPLCMNPSAPTTASDDPVMLLNALRVFSVMMKNVTYLKVPSCYPAMTEVPENHRPPLMSRLDGWLTLSDKHREEYEDILSKQSEDFVHGEALTSRSNAERVNYLLLLWYFLKGNKDVYTKPNTISMDFVHPTIVHRIVAANQDKPECGYAVHCLPSGSCFTADLHSGDGSCLDYLGTQRMLWNHAEGRYVSWEIRYYTFWTAFVVVKMLIVYSAFKPSKQEEEAEGSTAK